MEPFVMKYKSFKTNHEVGSIKLDIEINTNKVVYKTNEQQYQLKRRKEQDFDMKKNFQTIGIKN